MTSTNIHGWSSRYVIIETEAWTREIGNVIKTVHFPTISDTRGNGIGDGSMPRYIGRYISINHMGVIAEHKFFFNIM